MSDYKEKYYKNYFLNFYDKNEWDNKFSKYQKENNTMGYPAKEIEKNLVFFKKQENFSIFFDKNHHYLCLLEECAWDKNNNPLEYSILFVGRIAGSLDVHLTMIDDCCCFGGCDHLIDALKFLNQFLDDKKICNKFWGME